LVILDPRGRVFIARRKDVPDAWQMPQGGIDPGETPGAAGLRELWEETGIGPESVRVLGATRNWLRYDLPPHLLGKSWGGRWCGQEQLWLALLFTGDDPMINLNASGEQEFDAWRWELPEQLPALAVDFKRPIYQAVLEEFQPWIEAIREGRLSSF
jgi:putative (di)nucleoside polyphosphate hydrolase